MYNLFPAILLVLPSLSFATPARPINSLLPNATDPLLVNIGSEPIDPRFSMQPLYQAVPLAEDDCLVAAVQLLGLWGSKPFTGQEPTITYWDDYFPRVVIISRSPGAGGAIEVRFLVWGLYLGLKDMIESHRFRNVQLVLRWEGQVVALISIKKRQSLLSAPGENLINATNVTNVLRQRSSLNQLDLFTSEILNGASFNRSVPITASADVEMAVKVFPSVNRPLSKYSLIMAILDGILAVASHLTRAPLVVPVQIQTPAPYGANLRVVPERTILGPPHLTFGFVALALRQIPAGLLLRVHQWVEINFEVLISDVLVGRGAIAGGDTSAGTHIDSGPSILIS